MKVTREIAQNSLESIRKKGYITGGSDLNDTFDWNIVVTYINDLQSLTPPTADDIVKGLELELSETEWEYNKSSKMFSQIITGRIGWRDTIEMNDLYMLSSISLILAHKITSFFMTMEEK